MQTHPTEHASAARRARIALSGTLRVEIGDRDVAARLPGRQGRALFAFLVLHRHRPVSRGELIDVLWPDVPPADPEGGLATVLARSRSALGEGVLRGRAELQIVLAPETEIDIERAAAAAAAAERSLAAGDPRSALASAEAALEVIAQPLLPGIEGDWVDARRGELAGLEPACSRSSPARRSSSATASTWRSPSASRARSPSATRSASPAMRC